MSFWARLERAGGPWRWWLPLSLAFLFVCFSRIDDGGTNARARFATLRAMAVDHTFRIDRYQDWTDDWARSPEGHYYANKAPGPTLLAFPLFWAIDQALMPWQGKHLDSQGRLPPPRGIHKVAVSAACQVLPFLLFTLLALPLASAVGGRGYVLALLAILFGNTAAALMSSFVGNPFAGLAVLAFAYFYLRGRFAWASFCFGWVVLADYAEAVLVVPYVGLLLLELRERGWRALGEAVAGAAFPGLLWIWYHTACFGGPFSLPWQYDVSSSAALVAGGAAKTGISSVISFLPNPRIVWAQIAGPERGLLFTQPWLLFVVAAFLFRPPAERLNRRLFYFAVVSLALLISLNSGFPGWHGGGTPGPRYLAAALPVFGLFLPELWSRLSAPGRSVLALTVAIPVVLRGLVYSTWLLAPPEPIWPYYLGAMRSPGEWMRFALFVAALTVALFFTRRINSPNGEKRFSLGSLRKVSK